MKKKRSSRGKGKKLANNLFSFSLDRHIRQHLYRFVDYANIKGGVGDIEKNNNNMKKKESQIRSFFFIILVTMTTYFMLRESHKGGELRGILPSLYKYAKSSMHI